MLGSSGRGRWWLLLPLLLLAAPSDALNLARNGKALLPILLAHDASPEEQTAARELAHYLSAVSGARFEIKTEDTDKTRWGLMPRYKQVILRFQRVPESPFYLRKTEWEKVLKKTGR